MIRKITLALALILGTTVTLAQQPGEQASQPSTAEAAMPLPANSVPKLNIVWDCGKCTVNEKVVPLIVEAYRLEAAAHRKTVSEAQSIEARINDYRQRNPGARVMLGIMAGKDRLGLELTYNGQKFEVSDYSANAIEGMNALCESVAKKAYKKVASLPVQSG
jgi:hypothetical protein